MKNLLIYISPTKSFDNPREDLASNDAGPLIKVQIDNSVRLGWDLADILLVTNFPYEYAGVHATVLPDVEFFERKPQASKINAIVKMYEQDMIEKDELYWFHDLDAFQLEPISEEEINISNAKIAATDFGGAKFFRGEQRWSGGVFYFRYESHDIFKRMRDIFYKLRIDEEEALTILMQDDEQIRERVKKLNNSYNFIGYNLKACYEKSIKPLKVVHFHPLTGKKRLGGGKITALQFFMGENPLGIRLVTREVIELLQKHSLA